MVALRDEERFQPVSWRCDQAPASGWFANGRSVLAARGGGLPWRVDRLDLSSGQRTPMLEAGAPDGAGLRLSVLALAPDGRHYVHAYSRLLTDLFLVQGFK